MSTSNHYTDGFFTRGEDAILTSAKDTVAKICSLFNPQSVVDVGCGTGLWLSEFQSRGVEVLGIDGDYVNRELLRIPAARFLPKDLTQPFTMDRQFDLVMSLEVAEHLPPESAADFVRSLVALGPVIVFSAAVPGQGGVQHLNEQWPAYWTELFRSCGYEWADLIRPSIWLNERILWQYRQNTFVFFKRGGARSTDGALPMLPANGSPLPLVHPAMYRGLQYNTDPAQISMASAFRFARSAVSAAIRRKLGVLR